MKHELLTLVTAEASKLKSGFSKEAAFNLLKSKMVEGEADFSAKELAVLYRFFMPQLPAKPKSALHWVAKAMGVKDVRDYLNYMHLHSCGVKGKTLAATDGHRLHIEEDTDKEASTDWLDKAGNPCAINEYAYPNIWQVINPAFNTETPRVTVSNSLEWLESLPKGEMKCQKGGKPAPFALWGGQAFNLGYLQDAACLGLPCEITKPDTRDGLQAIGFRYKLEGKTLRAVVMPIRLEPEQLEEYRKLESLG